MKKIKVIKLGGAFFVALIMRIFFSFFKGQDQVLYVVSAVKGITRVLDDICYHKHQKDVSEKYRTDMINRSLLEFVEIHMSLIGGLFNGAPKKVVEKMFYTLYEELKATIYGDFKNKDQYDASILKYGELASSKILSTYLNSIGKKNVWFDARDYVLTDGVYRNARIKSIDVAFKSYFLEENILITQGFIGKSVTGKDTIVGYDGSDKSAADFAIELSNDDPTNVVEMTFFKDVEGVLNGNPKEEDISNLKMYEKMTYEQYFLLVAETGSYVVRVDSIEDLANAKNKIVTKVRSYINLDNPGTEICHRKEK